MNAERFQQVTPIFRQAVELSPDERPAFLEAACTGDAALRQDVERLISAHERAGSFIESPAYEKAAVLLTDKPIDSRVGQLIEHYKVVASLGKGGMGEVYLARDTKLGRSVALKILPADVAADGERMRRFTQEAKAAAGLNHPNIAHIYEVGESGGTHFIAMEHVDGVTLGEKIHRERAPLGKLLKYLTQVAEGLAKAHGAGIVHRDLKPDNIMIARDDYAKILDFGLAKLVEPQRAGAEGDASDEAATAILAQHSTPGMIMGSAGYMSPEQAQGKVRELDHRSDIFSFGCILFEAATRQRAFAGKDLLDSLHKIVHAPTPQIKDVISSAPDELQRIVRRCLAKEPDKRYQSIKEVAIELDELRQELKKRAGLDHSVQPESGNAETTISSQGAKAVSIQSPRAYTTQTEMAHSTSSAEYLVSGIKKRKSASIAGLVTLLLAAAVLGFWYFSNRSLNTSQIESIAVMPFVNASGNADVEYLSDGMTESLISSLSQLPKLSVKARSSVFRYKGKDVSSQTVGNELSVQAVLLGRVIQRGDQLTLSLELVDAATENVIWSEQYNRKQTDLVSLQSEIARDVSNKLRHKLSGADEQKLAKNYTENTEAYQLYLKGRFDWNKRTAPGLQKSIEYFNQAVAVDPSYALAYAGLADSYAVLPFYTDAEPSEAFPKAKAAATRAQEIDDSLVEAHTTLAHVRMWHEWDWPGAERGFKRAIELNSNYPTAHHWYSLHLSFLERHGEALTEIRRAYELDPFSLSINLDMGVVHFHARRYDEAIKQFHKTLKMDANFFHAYLYLANAYEQKGMYEEAAVALEKVIILNGGSAEMAASVRNGYKASGERGYFQEKLKLLMGRWRRQEKGGYEIAEVHVSLGEQDRAFEWLEKDYERHDLSLVNLRVTPKFDGLRSDPRFQDLLRRVGLVQ